MIGQVVRVEVGTTAVGLVAAVVVVGMTAARRPQRPLLRGMKL